MALDKTVRFLRFKKPRLKIRGTATAGTTGATLVCAGAGFDMGYVKIGDYVVNQASTARTANKIVFIDNANQLTVDGALFSGNNRFGIYEPFVPRVTASPEPVYQKAFLTSTADGTTLSYLEVSGENFLSSVKIGDKVYNTTDDNIQTVLAVISNTQLLLDGGGVDTGKTVHIFRDTKKHQYAYVNVSDLDTSTYDRPSPSEFNFDYPSAVASSNRDTANLYILPQGGSATDVELEFGLLRERAMNKGSWDRTYYNVDPVEAPNFVVHECAISAS
jgi:hypothetical protein